jgi:ubiquinone biosynthesis O-methyltransferase
LLKLLYNKFNKYYNKMELLRKSLILNQKKLLLKRFLNTNQFKTAQKLTVNKINDNQFTPKRSITTNSIVLRSVSEKYDNQNFKTSSSTVDENDINNFKKLTEEWWKENGEFEGLHRMNKLRVPLIRDAMASYLEHLPKFEKEKLYEGLDRSKVNMLAEPLAGLNILDIGCGGGILSECLSRLGAQVTGVDACKENILVAQTRLQQEYEKSLENATYCKRLRYLHCTIEELATVEENGNYFDAVVMSEVVEHVSNLDAFVEHASRLLKNQGFMFATTINKTLESYVLAIGVAEYVMNLVPRGTHDWNKFVKPGDLKAVMKRNDIFPKFEMGMLYNPLTRQWSWSEHSGINYALYGQKMKPTLNKN